MYLLHRKCWRKHEDGALALFLCSQFCFLSLQGLGTAKLAASRYLVDKHSVDHPDFWISAKHLKNSQTFFMQFYCFQNRAYTCLGSKQQETAELAHRWP
jgi:hypothetical protein